MFENNQIFYFCWEKLLLTYKVLKHSFTFWCRHLIGFFIFLALTIYTAMKIPKVVDLHSLQHIPDVLKKADLNKLREELKTTLPSMGLLPSVSRWHVMELLYNCLPERFSHGNQTEVCVLVKHFLS